MSKQLDRLTVALADRYTIERELGAGGMATVYLAEDVKHHRKVAVKVLRPELAAVLGAERFVQEIETTANLQHPHILPLFDSGEADGFLYYVMPFIDGESLRDKLDRETQLGVEEAVRIATDVAGALGYAHRHDVIHRDIKPENILLHDGRPVVADFGIALAVSAAAGNRMTETGLSLGTPHYMSPEQATAEKDLTNRSDIYSLGSVLYEMLTGEPPHTGSSAQQIIMKIVTEDAQDVTKLRKSVPPNVAAAVARSVEKLAADRFETAAKFAEALANPSFGHHTVGAGAQGGSRPDQRWRRIALALAITTTVAVLVALWSLVRPEESVPMLRVRPQLPDEEAILNYYVGLRSFALSSDGRRYVYLGRRENGGRRLWIRDLARPTASPVTGTDGACCPTFSPDGRSVAYIDVDQGLRVLNLDNGVPTVVGPGFFALEDLHWGGDGHIYAGSAGDSRGAAGASVLRRVRVDDLSPDGWERLTTIDNVRKEDRHVSPVLLPNGQAVLFTVVYGDATPPQVAVLDIKTGNHKLLLPGTASSYASPGYIVYAASDGSLMAAPFDQRRLEITGSAVPLGGRVRNRGLEGARDLSVTRDGTVLYAFGGTGQEQIVWVDRSGNFVQVDSSWVGDFETVAISPNGRRLAVSLKEGGDQQLWIRDLPDGSPSKLTIERGINFRAWWSPDNDRLLFVSNRTADDAPFDLYSRRVSEGVADVVLDLDRDVWEGEWSPDGQWLIYRTGVPPTRDLFVKHTHPDSLGRTIAASDNFQEVMPTLSPDGKWLAYQADETGVYEIYVRPFPNIDDDKRPVSTNGGTEPVWSGDGTELFYKNLEGQLVSAKVDTRTGFTVTQRDVLFSVRDYQAGDEFCCHPTYDVSVDGRFLMIRRTESNSGLILIQNALGELTRSRGN